MNSCEPLLYKSNDETTTSDPHQNYQQHQLLSFSLSISSQKDIEMTTIDYSDTSNYDKKVNFGCFNQTRKIILILSLISLTLVYANSLAFNFTVICMDHDQQYNNSVIKWLDSPKHVNGLFSAIAVGSFLGTLPLMHLIQHLGIRITLTVYGVASGIVTVLFPLAVSNGYVWIFLARAIQGTATGISFSSVGAITSQWAAISEAGTFIAILSTYIQLSSILTMSSAGIICESFGWPILYYSLGILTLISFTIFYIFYRNHPRDHSNINGKELQIITKGKPNFIKTPAVPYLSICTSKVIISVWLSCIGGSIGFIIFLYYGPTYMHKVLGFDVKSTGFATALPYVLGAATKFISGPLSDRATCIGERARLLLFAVVSQGCMAMCFIVIAFTSSTLVAQIAYTTSIVFSGLNIVGTMKCAQLVARQHVHFVMAVISMAMCFLTLLLPIIVVLVCPDNTPDQWSNLFLGTAVFLIIMNIPFAILADDKPAEWTKSSKSDVNATTHNINR